MALETLRGIDTIGGFSVHRVSWNHPADNYIEVDGANNAITFKLQDGPIGAMGVNGCQVDTLIDAARVILHGLDKQFPCDENKLAIKGLCTALGQLHKRREDRKSRGVEGKNEA